MVKRVIIAASLLLFLAPLAFSIELLSEEQAVKRMFLTADNVKQEKKTLTAPQIEELKKKLAGKLYEIKKPDGQSENEFTFHIGSKGGAVTGVAVILSEIDRWGPLKFIIVVDPATGKVENMAMLEYIDQRARNLSNRNYLKNFFGKGLADPIQIGKDVDGLSGATVSSEVLAHMVRKAIALVVGHAK
ncbi:MAG: FMN-binding protein [Fibrobacteres bacterium]|nr:FMN-binding protein [Fibrobacterota bacterium]